MNKIENRYLIPNIVTSANMMLGFLSIVLAMNGKFLLSAWFIIIAMIADGLDGKTARLLNGFSEFGKEYDSFCDAVSFGMAPSLLTYSILKDAATKDTLVGILAIKEIGVIISFLYLLCAVLRLVRFNIITIPSKEKADFIGMPSPTAAGLVATYYIFTNALEKHGLLSFNMNIFIAIVIGSAFLMVSNVKFKTVLKTFKVKSIIVASGIALFLAVTAKYSLFPFGVSYFIINLYRHYRNKINDMKNEEQEQEKNKEIEIKTDK